MTTPTRFAIAAAALLLGGGLTAAHATQASGPTAPSRYVQMDSAGDGLDKGAAAEGNARPSGMKKKKKSKKRM